MNKKSTNQKKAMKKSKKERNPTTNELIAATFKRTENYVKHVLKVGDVNPDMLDRVQEGRMALYIAYSRAISEERKEKQEVPQVAEVNQFEPDTAEELTADPTHVTAPVSAVTIAEDNTITFRCPCGSGKTYVINLNSTSNEQ